MASSPATLSPRSGSMGSAVSGGGDVHHNPSLEWNEFPCFPSSYFVLEEIGTGATAAVYRAKITDSASKFFNEIVAIKFVDLENVSSSLEEIQQETLVMRSLVHPNVVPLYVSFVGPGPAPPAKPESGDAEPSPKQAPKGHFLWMVMPYIAGGSVLNIMRWGHSEGLDEPQLIAIIRDTLKALVYLHRDGKVHRDVKAGNLLVTADGTVRLADFGVASPLRKDAESWGTVMGSAAGKAKPQQSGLTTPQAQRNTFVGTPCWMAPEVMEQVHGYNTSADIWSLGITALELAHGKAPFAKYPPMKVMLMTLQNDPPALDSEADKKRFSKALRDVVDECLQKDPSKRPTAAKLLEKPLFQIKGDTPAAAKKAAASAPPAGDSLDPSPVRTPAAVAAAAQLAKTLVEPLPSLPERVRRMREREGRSMALAEAKRREEGGGGGSAEDAKGKDGSSSPAKGISGWNFDVVGIKAEAARQDQDAAASLGSIPEGVPSVPGAQNIPQVGKLRKPPQQRGRFALYDDDDDAPPLEGESPPRVSRQMTSSSAGVSSGMAQAWAQGTPQHAQQQQQQQKPPHQPKVVEKGRFLVVEETDEEAASSDQKKPALKTSTSLKNVGNESNKVPSRPLSPCSSSSEDFLHENSAAGRAGGSTHGGVALTHAVDSVRAKSFGRDGVKLAEEERIVAERITRNPAVQAMLDLDKLVRKLAEENARLRLRNVELERRLNALENAQQEREEALSQIENSDDDD